jgi:hypothetical protein
LCLWKLWYALNLYREFHVVQQKQLLVPNYLFSIPVGFSACHDILFRGFFYFYHAIWRGGNSRIWVDVWPPCCLYNLAEHKSLCLKFKIVFSYTTVPNGNTHILLTCTIVIYIISVKGSCVDLPLCFSVNVEISSYSENEGRLDCNYFFFWKRALLLLKQAITSGLCITKMHTAVWKSQSITKK